MRLGFVSSYPGFVGSFDQVCSDHNQNWLNTEYEIKCFVSALLWWNAVGKGLDIGNTGLTSFGWQIFVFISMDQHTRCRTVFEILLCKTGVNLFLDVKLKWMYPDQEFALVMASLSQNTQNIDHWEWKANKPSSSDCVRRRTDCYSPIPGGRLPKTCSDLCLENQSNFTGFETFHFFPSWFVFVQTCHQLESRDTWS